jgi:hypothetical protein
MRRFIENYGARADTEVTVLLSAIIVIGFWVFNREAPHIAEDL